MRVSLPGLTILFLSVRSSSGYYWWGQLSPYHSAPSSAATADDVPEIDGCRLTFASWLVRHGSRCPKVKKYGNYVSVLTKLRNARSNDAEIISMASSSLDSINHPGADLTLLGDVEMRNLGTMFAQRYKSLLQSEQPYLRASDSLRDIQSAQQFAEASSEEIGTKVVPNIVEIPEGKLISTLDYTTGMCPAFDRLQDTAPFPYERYRDAAFRDILTQLNDKIPGPPKNNLKIGELMLLLELCPRLGVATPDGIVDTVSPFCTAFDPDSWHKYDYYQSIKKWYQYGPGNSLGPTQGAGWVQELLARINKQRDIVTNPATKTTSDINANQNEQNFPLEPDLFADFTHSNIFTSVTFALGLYESTPELSLQVQDTPTEPVTGYSAENAVPLGARIGVELMQCSGQKDPWVRILMNDQVHNLPKASRYQAYCSPDPYGRCPLPAFNKAAADIKNGMDWKKC